MRASTPRLEQSLSASLAALLCCVNFAYIHARKHPILASPALEHAFHPETGILEALEAVFDRRITLV